MLLEFLVDKLVDYHEYEPLRVLGAHGSELCGEPQQLAARRNRILEELPEIHGFLDLYRDVLQAPTLQNVMDFFTACNLCPTSMQHVMHVALRFLVVHDAGAHDIDGCSATGIFLGNQEVVHTAFMHIRCGIGVTAIAKEKGIARSTVYDHLERFTNWPARAQEAMLDCMNVFDGRKFDPEAAIDTIDAC